MARQAYVAFDLGAESGRAMLAVLDEQKITLEEVHRFANTMQLLPSGLHWNTVGLWGNLLEGLTKCVKLAHQRKLKIVSLGVDTWGVDFALLGASGQLLGLPFAYRDPANQAAQKQAFSKVKPQEIYAQTGIQFMPINSLYQLVKLQRSEPGLLDLAQHLLFMPDLLHYFFSGKMVNEASIASTSQMVDPHGSKTGQWCTGLLKKLKLPTKMLGDIVPAGTRLGVLREEVAREVGAKEEIEVITPGGHDTACAVAAVPVDEVHMKRGSWAYLSSGTWSLMGAELDEPMINAASTAASFTHERGVAGKIRFLKNIAGLWLVQECRRAYLKQGRDLSYGQLMEMAEKAEPFRTLVDPAYEPFATPGEMLEKMNTFASQTKQHQPRTPGEYVRCCLESLALCYRQTMETMEALLDRKFEVLHIVGGGGRNLLLNQMTADVLNRPVIVGPEEATAVGNALTQAMGRKQIKDLSHLRKIVRQSFELTTYEPLQAEKYQAVYERYLQLTK